MSLYRDTGVVLRTYRLGEADRIVVLMTAQHGKVRAVAKGVRKTKSRFGGRLEPMSHVALLLYEGRQLDVINQAESLDYLRAVREDLDRLTRAMALLEVVDQVAQEREPDPRLYQMLVGALRTLAAQPAPLARARLLLEGAGQRRRCAPSSTAACRAASPEPLVAFDVTEGGVLCRTCRRGVALSPDALDLLRRILGGDLVGALAEPASPATHEVEVLAIRAMEHHLERRLRAVSLLEG